MDTTDLKVRLALYEGVADAYGYRPVEGELLHEMCGGCAHHQTCHSTAGCGESGCDCRSFRACESYCPACKRPWDEPRPECPGCGLSLSAAALSERCG